MTTPTAEKVVRAYGGADLWKKARNIADRCLLSARRNEESGNRVFASPPFLKW